MPNVKIDQITVGDRFRKDLGDLAPLAASIGDIGLLQPIGLTDSKALIFGARRLEACRLLGMSEIPSRYLPTVEQLIQAEHDENELRQDFNPVERVEIQRAVAAELGERRGSSNVQDLVHWKGTKTAEIASKKAGFGNRETGRQAAKVVDKGAPEVIEAMASGELTVNAAAQLADLHTIEDQVETLKIIRSGDAKNPSQAKRRLKEKQRSRKAKGVKRSGAHEVVVGGAVELISAMESRPACAVFDPPYGLDTHTTRKGGHDYADGDEYALDLLCRTLGELVPKLAEDGHVYIFSGYSLLAEFREIMSQVLDVQDNPIVWVKNNHTMCDFSKWYPSKHEYVLFGRIPGSRRELAKCIPDVLEVARSNETTHSAEKPVDLLSVFIEQSTLPGELVIDPFAGSGSTGVAAKKLGRAFLGFELDPKWAEVANARLV